MITIKHALRLLSQSEIVAIPTETVYGLAANAYDDMAVAKIFALKQRPHFNPLIVHVASIEQAQEFCEWSDTAQNLAKTFWPGPLTFILPTKPKSALSSLVTAGLNCVGVRMPNHPITLNILKEFGKPLAAPSANQFMHISPTSAADVKKEFPHFNNILDGGKSEIGLESSIIDLTETPPKLLRLGGLSLDKLPPLIQDKSGMIKAPGMLKKHYAPHTRLRINARYVFQEEGLLAFGIPLEGAKLTLNLSASGDINEAAANFFAMLRKLDEANLKAIAVQPIPDEGLGLAINDRLIRASTC